MKKACPSDCRQERAEVRETKGRQLAGNPAKRHKAGLVGPAVLVVELVRPILFRSSAQNVENWWIVARASGLSTHDSGFSDAVERSQISICRGFTGRSEDRRVG